MKAEFVLCDLKKAEVEKRLHQITEIVSQPRFICRKCCRVAKQKKYLCKPIALSG